VVQLQQGIRIHPDRGGEISSFIFSAIQSQGYRSLTDGDRVEFDVVESTKGARPPIVTKV
jgi:cold shock CspA family protein